MIGLSPTFIFFPPYLIAQLSLIKPLKPPFCLGDILPIFLGPASFGALLRIDGFLHVAQLDDQEAGRIPRSDKQLR